MRGLITRESSDRVKIRGFLEEVGSDAGLRENCWQRSGFPRHAASCGADGDSTWRLGAQIPIWQ